MASGMIPSVRLRLEIEHILVFFIFTVASNLHTIRITEHLRYDTGMVGVACMRIRMRMVHAFGFLPVVCWLVLAGVGVGCFWQLDGIGELTADGTPRNILDKSIHYLFLLLVPFGAYMAQKEYREARDRIPLVDAEAERRRRRRQRKKQNKELIVDRPLDEAIKREALLSLELLITAGVVGRAEMDEADFFDLCRMGDLEDGGLYEISGCLALHDSLDNALFIPDQVEVTVDGVKAMIEGFARLAGVLEDLADLSITTANPRQRASDGTARFRFKGVVQIITFEYHNKNASGDLMDALAALFNPAPAYALAYFDWVYLVTRLTEPARVALNGAIDADYETFERLKGQPMG